jgi:hypothetical protein
LTKLVQYNKTDLLLSEPKTKIIEIKPEVRMKFQSKKQSLFRVAPVLLLPLFASFGCGKNSNPVANFVNQLELKTYVSGSDEWVQMTSNLTTGNFMLTGINVPITDPRDRNLVYGEISLSPTLCNTTPCQNTSDLRIALNITQIIPVPATSPLLPNGTNLPVGGLQNSKIVALPIADTGAVIYFAFGPNVAMLGTALPFSALDPAGQYVPGVNVFQPLQLGTVSLIAGLFAGSAPKTTGFGLFVDLSQVINNSPTLAALSADPLSSIRISSASSSIAPHASKLSFQAVTPSSRNQNKLYKKLYELHQKGTVLTLE